jgi:hypothetical protein
MEAGVKVIPSQTRASKQSGWPDFEAESFHFDGSSKTKTRLIGRVF